MWLSEWLMLDSETRGVHCLRVAAERLGQTATPATISAAAAEVRQQFESAQATVPCFTLVCTGFTTQIQTALHYAPAETRKRKLSGQGGGKRVKKETS